MIYISSSSNGWIGVLFFQVSNIQVLFTTRTRLNIYDSAWAKNLRNEKAPRSGWGWGRPSPHDDTQESTTWRVVWKRNWKDHLRLFEKFLIRNSFEVFSKFHDDTGDEKVMFLLKGMSFKDAVCCTLKHFFYQQCLEAMFEKTVKQIQQSIKVPIREEGCPPSWRFQQASFKSQFQDHKFPNLPNLHKCSRLYIPIPQKKQRNICSHDLKMQAMLVQPFFDSLTCIQDLESRMQTFAVNEVARTGGEDFGKLFENDWKFKSLGIQIINGSSWWYFFSEMKHHQFSHLKDSSSSIHSVIIPACEIHGASMIINSTDSHIRPIRWLERHLSFGSLVSQDVSFAVPDTSQMRIYDSRVY